MKANKTQFIQKDLLKKLVGRYKKNSIVSEIEANLNDPTFDVEVKKLSLFPLLSKDNYLVSSLKILENSIGKEGIDLPVYIYEFNNNLTVINGVKRFLIAKKNGLEKIRCTLVKASVDKVIVYILNNMISNNDNLLVQGYAFKVLIDEFKMSEENIQNLTNLPKGRITCAIKLLSLSEDVKKLLLQDKLNPKKAKLLVNFKSSEVYSLAKKIIPLSYKEAEIYLRKIKSSLKENGEINDSKFSYCIKDAEINIHVNDEKLKEKIIKYLKEISC